MSKARLGVVAVATAMGAAGLFVGVSWATPTIPPAPVPVESTTAWPTTPPAPEPAESTPANPDECGPEISPPAPTIAPPVSPTIAPPHS